MIEFRLYYDNEGRVVSYTCEPIQGNYIVIDAITFAQARPDIRVVDGKIIWPNVRIIQKLIPDEKGDICCAADDISIVLEDNQVAVKRWTVKTTEYYD